MNRPIRDARPARIVFASFRQGVLPIRRAPPGTYATRGSTSSTFDATLRAMFSGTFNSSPN